MESYYTLLGVAPDASTEQIEHAYSRERQRYSLEHIEDMGEDFAQIAQQRLAAIEQAHRTLADPQARAAYDAGGQQPTRERSSLSRRELAMLLGGAAVGLALIMVVWVFAGRSTTRTISMVKMEKPAPAFELNDIEGRPLRLDSFFGQGKVVLVNFWYSKCAPCEAETPALQQTYQKLSDQGLVVIGVNVRGNEQNGPAGEQDVKNFVSRYGVTYPIVYDEQGAVGRSYQVLPLPSSFFIDPEGTIRYASYTSLTAQDVERVFNELQQHTAAMR